MVLGEEALVTHQPLVHRPQLVDAQFGVGDEPAVLPAPLLGKKKAGQDFLKCPVPQTNLVNEGCGRGGEEVRPQRVELDALRVVTVETAIHQPE